jgi:hypothetical protein
MAGEADHARAARRRAAILGALLSLFALALTHGPHLHDRLGQRHWEDRRFFVHNRNQIGSWTEAFTEPGAWPGLYRPLSTNVYYRAGRLAWNNRIEVYQAVNAAVLATCTLLLLALSLRMLPPAASWLPPVLFASREAAAQATTASSEFQGLSATALALLAYLLWTSGMESRTGRRAGAGLVCLFVAVLCKETAVVTVGLLALHGLMAGPPHRWRRLAGPAAIGFAWTATYLVAVSSFGDQRDTGFRFDPGPGMATRLVGLGLFFFDGFVVVDASGETWPAPALAAAIASPLAWLAAAGALVAAVAGLAARWRGTPLDAGLHAATLGACWFAVAAAPYTLLADRLFPRYAMLAHAGLALAAGGLAAAALGPLRGLLPRASRLPDPIAPHPR